MATQPKPIDPEDVEGRLDFILGHETKEAAPSTAAEPAEDTPEPAPQDVEAALAKLDSAPAKVEAEKSEPEETPALAEEDKGQTEPAKPALEPPKFWNAEARDKLWPTLPPEVQQAILTPEQEAEKARAKSITEASEQRKQAEQLRQQAEQEAQRLVAERQSATQQLALWVQKMMASDPIIAEGQKIDWAKEWQDNPSQAGVKQAQVNARMQQWGAAWQTLQTELNQQFQAQANEANKQRQSFLQKQNELLFQKLPEWKESTEKAQTGFKQVVDFARDNHGITAEEIHNLGDHRLVLLLKSDMTGKARVQELEAKVADLEGKLAKSATAKADTLKAIAPKKVATAPKTAAPRAASEERQPSRQLRDLRNLARKTGKDHDRVNAVLAALQEE